jgi:folylpolyglutamate synthase/dihydropteroate synthase
VHPQRLEEGAPALARGDPEGSPPARRPTFFEAVTVLALKIFRAAGVDFVVWENGTGGKTGCHQRGAAGTLPAEALPGRQE